MKYLICCVSLLFSFSVQAAYTDARLGNVIAVERELSDVYSECVAHMTNSAGDISKPSRYYYCKFSFVEKNDLSQSTQAFLRADKNDSCMADGDLENGKAFIMFGLKDKISSADEAKKCLAKLLNGKNTLKATVYTIQ